MTREPPRSDDFEASEMHDGAPVVARDKHVSRLMVGLLAVPGLFTALLGIYIAFANASSSKPVPTAVLPLVVAAIVALERQTG